MGKIDGVAIGIVKRVDDPEQLGRIQLTFPWLSDDNQTFWARIATLMAGSDRGSWFQPEIDDEVLVAFLHGDVQFPMVVGFLWSLQDKPPIGGIDGHVRRIKSVAGHIVDFDDRDGQNAVRITTAGGHKVTLDDTTPSVTIESITNCKIELRPDGISIDAGPGRMSLTTSMLDVQAPLATFSGVIQTQALVATSVISTSYTPGAGNLL